MPTCINIVTPKDRVGHIVLVRPKKMPLLTTSHQREWLPRVRGRAGHTLALAGNRQEAHDRMPPPLKPGRLLDGLRRLRRRMPGWLTRTRSVELPRASMPRGLPGRRPDAGAPPGDAGRNRDLVGVPHYFSRHARVRRTGSIPARAIESVLAQVYPHWELCIAVDEPPDPKLQEIVSRYCRRDARSSHPAAVAPPEEPRRRAGGRQRRFRCLLIAMTCCRSMPCSKSRVPSVNIRTQGSSIPTRTASANAAALRPCSNPTTLRIAAGPEHALRLCAYRGRCCRR